MIKNPMTATSLEEEQLSSGCSKGGCSSKLCHRSRGSCPPSPSALPSSGRSSSARAAAQLSSDFSKGSAPPSCPQEQGQLTSLAERAALQQEEELPSQELEEEQL